jgi:hypothetical protein
MATTVGCAISAAACTAPSGVCGFTLSHAAGSSSLPRFLGTQDVVALAQVASQPGSPVQVEQVDLNGVQNILNDDSGGSYGVQVRNVSDKAVSNIDVTLSLTRPREGGSLGSRFNGPLDPGKVAWVRGIGRFHADSALSKDTRILVAIESAEVGGCLYRPAQVLPVDGGSAAPARRALITPADAPK